MSAILRIGSRGSPLALWQAEWVAGRIRAALPGVACEIVVIRTEGDRRPDEPLPRIGGKGLFTREIERALLDGRIDLAVHSLKDLPTRLPQGLVLGAVPERADPRDALVARDGLPLAALPRGARVGTSAPRRIAQLRHLRPDLAICDVRGNVDTRLRRLAEGRFDAILLAMAGLQRLGLAERVTEVLDAGRMLPAVGQGALAVEARQGDGRVAAALLALADPTSGACTAAERGLLAALGGGCQVPLGALGERDGDVLRLSAVIASRDGRQLIRAAGAVSWPEGDDPVAPVAAVALGRRVADELCRDGASAILEAAARGGGEG